MRNSFSNENGVKMNHLPDLKMIQIQYETDTWKRLLAFMMEENIHHKNRLADILKFNFDKNMLDDIEGFQLQFVKEDELIGLLRREINELERLVEKEIYKEDHTLKEIGSSANKIRKNIRSIEIRFGDLKAAFNDYLLENFNPVDE